MHHFQHLDSDLPATLVFHQGRRYWRGRKRRELETAPDAISVSVELFGVGRMWAKTKTVTLSLPQGAILVNIFSAARVNSGDKIFILSADAGG